MLGKGNIWKKNKGKNYPENFLQEINTELEFQHMLKFSQKIARCLDVAKQVFFSS